MTETATVDRSKPKTSRQPAMRSRVKPAATGTDAKIVSASVMAAHLDMARSYLRKLVDDGVVAQLPDGRFNLNRVRVAYLRHLRTERRRSPGNAAAQAHTEAKTRLLEQRYAERDGRLVPIDIHNEMIAALTGAFLTAVGSLPALIGGRDIPLRRRCEDIIREARRRLSEDFQKQADRCEREIDKHREGIDK